jgi:hypothetical protein
MPPFTTDERLGTALLKPNVPAVAGAWGTWRLTYTAGRYGVDEGGTLRIARRFCSDSGTPQFDDPAGPHYTTIALETDGHRAWASPVFVAPADPARRVGPSG